MNGRADVAIVGGAVMGSALAYFLKAELGFAGDVVVLERDQGYRQAATGRSTSGYRQQFSTGVNIELSRWSAAFLAEANERLTVGEEAPGIPVSNAGYLYLGGPAHVEGFVANHALQRAHGVDVALLGPNELRRRFPWLNAEDVAIGSLGLSGEGWFDGYLLMRAFGAAARARGAMYRQAEVTAIASENDFRLTLADGHVVVADRLVLTAGAWTASLAAQLSIHLPVGVIKQSVFTVECPMRAADMPFLFTPDRLFCRPEGRDYLAGIGIGDNDPDVSLDDLEPDHDQFDREIWPLLAHRIAAFEEARFRGAWAGHYDYCRFDHNPFIGSVDERPGLYLATGFSGHGIMQSPGVGLALAELIMHGEYRTMDLTPLSLSRLAQNKPVREGIQY